MGVTSEGFVYFFTALNIIAGLWLAYKFLEPELRDWRKRQRARREAASSSHPPVHPPNPTSPPRFIVAVRGYDSPELRREDTLVRIRRLGDKIAKYLREMERYKELK
jgi:hypothetical protein